MAILDSIKDPSTGQIKKPILYSLIGGGALFAYLIFKNRSTSASSTSSTGQSTALTPDLTALEQAIQGLAGNKTSITPTTTSSGAPSYTRLPFVPGPTSKPIALLPGSSGAAGGGGGGTGQVLHPIAKAPTVYAGLTHTPIQAASNYENPPFVNRSGQIIMPGGTSTASKGSKTGTIISKAATRTSAAITGQKIGVAISKGASITASTINHRAAATNAGRTQATAI